MIERKDILPMSFLQKSAFTGSYQGMRYRLEKVSGDGGERLSVCIWPEPYNYAVTPEEQKERREFPFSEEGVVEATGWLNAEWQGQEGRWRKARENW